MFRGREVTHPERGTAILDRLAEELAELGVIEQHPTQEGRNMTMMMAPSKAVLAGGAGGGGGPGDAPHGGRPRGGGGGTIPRAGAPRAPRRPPPQAGGG